MMTLKANIILHVSKTESMSSKVKNKAKIFVSPLFIQ